MSAGLLVGLLATGCTRAAPTEPTPEAPSAVTRTPSSTATPSPTVDVSVPPARPEAMATPSADGAAAAASYFISLYPYVYLTGDTSEWTQMSAQSCEFCTRTLDGARRVHDAGNSVSGGAIEILAAQGTEIDAGRWYSARLTAVEAPSTESDPAGAPVTASDGGRYTFEVALTHESGRWLVDAVDVRPADS